jgi:hypothetical protein
MKTSLTIAIFLSVGRIASAYTPAELAAESKKANDFFAKCWDETLSRHPVDESFYGIKTHYDQLEDLSDEKATADEKVWERQLAELQKNIKFDALDAQTQLSYKLFRARGGARSGRIQVSVRRLSGQSDAWRTCADTDLLDQHSQDR